MIDFNTIKVGDNVEVVGMGAPGFAKLGDILEITIVHKDRVFAQREDGKEAFFALTCGASRLSLLGKRVKMDNLIERLRKEASRNAQMQGDKNHQTNKRRKTFRYRNHLFTEAADTIAELEAVAVKLFKAVESLPIDALGIVPETHDCPAYPIRDAILHDCIGSIRTLLGKESEDE